MYDVLGGRINGSRHVLFLLPSLVHQLSWSLEIGTVSKGTAKTKH